MPLFGRQEETAHASIVQAELSPEARLRYIQRRLQEEEGTRLSIDSIAYVLKLNADFADDKADA